MSLFLFSVLGTKHKGENCQASANCGCPKKPRTWFYIQWSFRYPKQDPIDSSCGEHKAPQQTWSQLRHSESRKQTPNACEKWLSTNCPATHRPSSSCFGFVTCPYPYFPVLFLLSPSVNICWVLSYIYYHYHGSPNTFPCLFALQLFYFLLLSGLAITSSKSPPFWLTAGLTAESTGQVSLVPDPTNVGGTLLPWAGARTALHRAGKSQQDLGHARPFRELHC